MSESSPPHNPLGQDPCDPQTHPAAMEPTQPPPPLPPETPEMPTLSDARAGLVDASAPSLPPAPSSKSNATTFVALGVVAGLGLLMAWQVASDRWVPYTARGAASGYIAQLTPRVSGQVTEVKVQDGALVEAGQPLAQLDPTSFDLAIRQAEAGIARALQSNRASATGIVAAQAGVTAARSQRENVQANAARTLQLVSRGFLSSVKADDARAEQRNADSQLQKAQAELERALITTGARDDTNPEVRSAQLQLEQAQLNRQFATLTAPTRGVVTNLRLAIGQYVAPGTPAMTFIDARGAWITVDLRENQLGNVRSGDRVGVVFDAVPGQVFEGRVQSVAWGIDVGRASGGGLLQNLPEGQWFEPARRIPVHVELDGGLDNWPRAVRIGGKASAVVYANGENGLLASIAGAMLRIRAWLSYLY